MTIHVTDVAIVGGGMVGGALALGLAQQGFTVTVLEKATPPAFDPASAPDVRISAISAASVGLLKSLGVWDAIRAMRVHAYRRLETWEWESAHVAFDAAELKLPELGYMVENKVLQWGLWQALAAHEAVTLRVGSELKTMQRGETQTALHLREGRRSTPGWLSAPTALTPGAGDGRHRRARLAISAVLYADQRRMRRRSRRQHLAAVYSQRPARLPAAVRPLGLAGLVRRPGADPSAAEHDHGAAPAGDRQLFSGAAGTGDAAGGRRLPAHPASCAAVCSARPGAGGRCGAHHSSTGGAGVNLGYRDVDALLEILAEARGRGEDWASLPVLKRYQARRRADNFIMQSGMDLFYAGFSNDLAPVRMLRNIGLMAAERAGVLKRQALKYALGL